MEVLVVLAIAPNNKIDILSCFLKKNMMNFVGKQNSDIMREIDELSELIDRSRSLLRKFSASYTPKNVDVIDDICGTLICLAIVQRNLQYIASNDKKIYRLIDKSTKDLRKICHNLRVKAHKITNESKSFDLCRTKTLKLVKTMNRLPISQGVISNPKIFCYINNLPEFFFVLACWVSKNLWDTENFYLFKRIIP